MLVYSFSYKDNNTNKALLFDKKDKRRGLWWKMLKGGKPGWP